jgi:hypothetical protein
MSGFISRGWPALEAADEDHGFATTRALILRQRLGCDRLRSPPIKQGPDALELGLGCRAQPSVITHALKTLGQCVLQDAGDELVGIQFTTTDLTVTAAPVSGSVLEFGIYTEEAKGSRPPGVMIRWFGELKRDVEEALSPRWKPRS